MANQVYAAQDLKYQAQPGLVRLGLNGSQNIPAGPASAQNLNWVFLLNEIPSIVKLDPDDTHITFQQAGMFVVSLSLQLTGILDQVLDADIQLTLTRSPQSLIVAETRYTTDITSTVAGGGGDYAIYQLACPFYARGGDILQVYLINRDTTGMVSFSANPTSTILAIQQVY